MGGETKTSPWVYDSRCLLVGEVKWGTKLDWGLETVELRRKAANLPVTCCALR